MPSSLPPGVELRSYAGNVTPGLIQQLGNVYADARAEPPYNADPRWRQDAFTSRTEQQSTKSGFLLVTADVDDEIVGFSFGQPIAPGRWFEGDTDPPGEILAAAKFAVIELDVRRSWRNRGIGRALLHQLLSNRPERYAMLSTLPDVPARQMYERWGWRKVSNTIPDSGLPPWDTLVLPLPAIRLRASDSRDAIASES